MPMTARPIGALAAEVVNDLAEKTGRVQQFPDTVADPFDWHRRALAGEKVAIHDGSPELGFFRKRAGRGGKWLPASIFRVPSGEIVAEVDGKELDPIQAWTWLAKEPVSEEAYRFHLDNGRWPSDAPPVADAKPGHNQPPEELPFEEDAAAPATAEAPPKKDPELDALMAQVEEARTVARQAYADLKLDAPESTAHRAQNIRERLQKQSKEIDALRSARKQPALDACRKWDDYFRDPIRLPLEIADQLAARIKAWRDAETARRRAEAEAERQRIIEGQRLAEENRRQAAAAAEAAGLEPQALPEIAPPPPVEPPKVLLGGGVSGRRSAGRTIVTAKIVDIDATFQHFKQHYEVTAVLQKLANAEIKRVPVPGCERSEEERV